MSHATTVRPEQRPPGWHRVSGMWWSSTAPTIGLARAGRVA
ncbi:MAG: hypothetical protein WCE29_16360 [Mycobacterium sp.]